jgi:hydroxyacylglutathione hydrolase
LGRRKKRNYFWALMLQLQSFAFNPFQENTFVVYDDTSMEGVIIDPGNYEPEENYELADFIKTNKVQVKMLLNTHCHIDHVLGNYFVKETYKVELYIHRKEEAPLLAVKSYAPSYGMFKYSATAPDKFLEEGDHVKFGNLVADVLFVPGHSPGHIAFHFAKEKVLMGGDVLFYNSIGRTDLPGGNHQTLIESIQKKIFTLPDDTVVYPGHGPETNVGFEKRTNPFCALIDAD